MRLEANCFIYEMYEIYLLHVDYPKQTLFSIHTTQITLTMYSELDALFIYYLLNSNKLIKPLGTFVHHYNLT